MSAAFLSKLQENFRFLRLKQLLKIDDWYLNKDKKG